MSFAQPNQDSRSPGFAPNLSSNNPFRNRVASPGPTSGPTSPLDPPPRPVSRNPFLDASPADAPAPIGSSDKMFTADTPAAPRSALTGNAADLFDNLTLNEKPVPSRTMRPPPSRSNTGERQPPPYSSTIRGENLPPRPHPGHRPTKSQEEAMRARRIAASSGSNGSKSRPTGELDIFADPLDPPRKSDTRRVRRNSESSVADRKPLDPEEEKKRQERKRRERERRHRDREGSSSKSKKPDRKLDVIDKLDVTSIYGTGLFHHDGPFDACNPHRNRQGSRRAPMQAFPKDSLNNVLGGGGPVNKRPDHAAFLGNNNEEAFKDYSKGGVGQNGLEPYGNGAPGKQAAIMESSTTKTEPIHGEETLGLGTSTFLEGAPASRTAMQRRESEHTSPMEGGLNRKKSLAQKIRGINNRREVGSHGRMTSSDDVMYSPEPPAYTPGGSKDPDANPFFNEFSKGDDAKKESITIVEPEKPSGRARAPSSPRRGLGERLERRVTSDGSSGPDAPAKPNGGGFLNRVKSLKGGPRKPRSEKPLPPVQFNDS